MVSDHGYAYWDSETGTAYWNAQTQSENWNHDRPLPDSPDVTTSISDSQVKIGDEYELFESIDALLEQHGDEIEPPKATECDNCGAELPEDSPNSLCEECQTKPANCSECGKTIQGTTKSDEPIKCEECKGPGSKPWSKSTGSMAAKRAFTEVRSHAVSQAKGDSTPGVSSLILDIEGDEPLKHGSFVAQRSPVKSRSENVTVDLTYRSRANMGDGDANFSADFNGPLEAFTTLNQSPEGFSGRAGGEKRIELKFKWQVDEPEPITDEEDDILAELGDELDGTNITVKSGGQGNRSQVFGNAITSGGGSIIVKQYGRVSGSVETDEGGNVKVEDNSRVDGDAITSGGGNVTVGNNGPSVVGGVAKTTATSNGAGKVEVVGEPPDQDDTRTPENPAKVLGGVRAGGVAKVEDAAVKNGVEAGADGDIVNSDICGNVIADGNIDVYEYTVIQDGDIKAKGTNADVDAGETIAGIQNSFVGGDVIAESGDIDFPSSVICGDIVAKNGAIDIYSEKTGPPLELDPNIPGNQRGGPRSEDRQRSLIGGVVRVEGEDCDIASATVFANGTTEPDKYDDDIAVLVTQKASGGDDSTITGGSILKGDVVVDGDLNVDIDGGSRVEGKVEANAGTVSLNNVTVTGPNPGTVDEDTLIIGDGGKIDTLDGNATIQGNVRVKSGGQLDVSGAATIEGDLIVESGGTANRGTVTVDGAVIRN